ncbi:glycosyltransferase family 2 protein [Cupriavidus sp. 8B]
MRVSLILATVDRREQVGRCLHSLAMQTDKNFEILLVDQNPDDRLIPFVNDAVSLGLTIKHIRILPPSLSVARNLGISRAEGSVIGLTDDDCWYEPDTISKIRKNLINDLSLDGLVGCWVEQSKMKQYKPQRGLLSLAAWRRFRGGDASSITLFFTRDIFTGLGGFDERLGVGRWFGAGEETDFLIRALAAGAKLQYCPDVRVHHEISIERKGNLLGKFSNSRKRARGTGAIYAKHRLSVWVILRGIIAPIMAPLLRGRWLSAAQGAFVSIGRLEGLVHWKFQKSK